MMKKKIDGINFQLKDIFFRVWKQIKINDENIKILETSISDATDMCTNHDRSDRPIMRHILCACVFPNNIRRMF